MVKRFRRVLLAVLMVPFALVVAFLVFTRHVPAEIPLEWRASAQLQGADGGLQLRFLGVTGYELSDGQTTILLDPTPTRPAPLELLSGPLTTDDAHAATLCPRADFILVNHTHFDHALDVGPIAVRTKAMVLGSQSTVNLAQSRGVPADKTRVVHEGDHLTLGTFTVDVRRSRHAAIGGLREAMTSVVPVDAGPLWFWQYGLDETLAYRLEAAGTTVWFHPTSTYAAGELGQLRAKTLIVGTTGEAMTAEKANGLRAESGAVRVLPTHYDNFFQPMQKGLAFMPGTDLRAPRVFFEPLPWLVLDYDERITLPPDEP